MHWTFVGYLEKNSQNLKELDMEISEVPSHAGRNLGNTEVAATFTNYFFLAEISQKIINASNKSQNFTIS